MPQMKLPTSKYLRVADVQKLKEEERLCVILDAPTESETNEEMVSCTVVNEKLGEKLIYDFKNKFSDFFEAYGCNTDSWVDKKLMPILPRGNSIYFYSFAIPEIKEEKIGK